MITRHRCDWPGNNPLMIKYHDEEWGVPIHDDKKLFELLILEGAQAGLTWQTVLNKRENYRKEFIEALKRYVDMGGNIKYLIYTNKIYYSILLQILKFSQDKKQWQI